MSANNGACKDLLKDTSVLQNNIMDYKSGTDNLKSILHCTNSRQIAEAVILTVNKFSSKCVIIKEESTSTIKWSNIVAGRKTTQLDFRKSTLHEIPTVISVVVFSKVEDNKPFSNPSTLRTYKTSANKLQNKHHKASL
jgi:hypothetical protein